MAEAASAQQAASATEEDTSQQRAGRRRRTSAEPRRAQQGATAAAAPAALDSLSRLQQLADASPQVAQLQRLQALVDASPQVAQLRRLQALADASPQVAQLRRLQALADRHYAPVAQLAGDPEEEELIQGQFASAELEPQLQQAPRANNTGLPDQLKSGIESLSGLSMDDVRVHYNSSQPAQLNALAYAQGSVIHLAPGQEHHLPHEAWHVVQQAQGRVRPTMQMKDGVPVNDDAGLEREADLMGAKAFHIGCHGDCGQLAIPPLIPRKSKSIHGLNRTSSVQKMSETEGIISDVIGAEENGKGWQIVEDIDTWFEKPKKLRLLDAKNDKSTSRILIHDVTIENGYNKTNAHRLVNKLPFQKDDIEENTEIKILSKNSFSSDDQYISTRTTQVTSFMEDEIPLEYIYHQLYFRMMYDDNGVAQQDYIARNPLLTTFFTSDVVEEQVRLIKRWTPGNQQFSMENDFTWDSILISNLINQTFLDWWTGGDPSPKEMYEMDKRPQKLLSEEHKEYFLENVPNGRLAYRNAQAAKKEVESIEVIFDRDIGSQSNQSFLLSLRAQESSE